MDSPALLVAIAMVATGAIGTLGGLAVAGLQWQASKSELTPLPEPVEPVGWSFEPATFGAPVGPVVAGGSRTARRSAAPGRMRPAPARATPARGPAQPALPLAQAGFAPAQPTSAPAAPPPDQSTAPGDCALPGPRADEVTPDAAGAAPTPVVSGVLAGSGALTGLEAWYGTESWPGPADPAGAGDRHGAADPAVTGDAGRVGDAAGDGPQPAVDPAVAGYRAGAGAGAGAGSGAGAQGEAAPQIPAGAPPTRLIPRQRPGRRGRAAAKVAPSPGSLALQRHKIRLGAYALAAAQRAAQARADADAAWEAAARAQSARDEAWRVLEAADAAREPEPPAAAAPAVDPAVTQAAFAAFRRGDLTVDELRRVWGRPEDRDPGTAERERARRQRMALSRTARQAYERAAADARLAQEHAEVAEVAALALAGEAEEAARDAAELRTG